MRKKNSKIRYQADNSFKHLASVVDHKLQQNKGKIGDQEKQVNSVLKLEKSFKNSLRLNKSLEDRLISVYADFIKYIKSDVGNILVAQSYFREKKTVFFKKISPLIKNENAAGLLDFNINYNLINFIVQNWGGPIPERSQEIYNKFLEHRQILIENNIPLAINRAKLFYRKTIETNLSLLDLVNICVTGLVAGIDKYDGAYSKVWRSVCIGRMVGFMIKEFSETFIKLKPTEKKILYRANMIQYRNKVEGIAELTKAVNDSFIEDRKKGMSIPKLPISEDTITALLNSVHHISADSKVNDENQPDSDGSNLYDYYEDESRGQDYYVEEADSMNQLSIAISSLDAIPKKIIRLKGVQV